MAECVSLQQILHRLQVRIPLEQFKKFIFWKLIKDNLFYFEIQIGKNSCQYDLQKHNY